MTPLPYDRNGRFVWWGFMLNRSKLVILAASLAVANLLPTAAQAASATASATANVLKPLVMTGGQTISLGNIVTPSTATFTGTFTVDAAATQTSSFCAAGFTCTGTVKSALFNLQGTNNANITFNVPLTVTMSLVGATGTPPTLILTTKNSIAANSGTGNYTIQLPNSGSPGSDFYVGGSVTINQATAGGTYLGSFTVTADYQ